jgi:glycosyltransferase involved in cell wall biosynthesis
MRRSRDTKLRVLFLGNMHITKGFRELIDAGKILLKNNVSIILRFVGAWPDRKSERLFEEAISGPISSHVEYCGAVTDPRTLKRYLLESHALALPTYYPFEAQPLVILEALNAGTPVIATDHGGIRDVVNPGINGFTVAQRDPADLAARLGQVRHSGLWEELSKGARKSFEVLYHPTRVRELWADCLRCLQCTPGNTAPDDSSQAPGTTH